MKAERVALPMAREHCHLREKGNSGKSICLRKIKAMIVNTR